MKKLLHYQGVLGMMLLTLMLVGISMTSCKKDYDPMGPISGMADKNIPNTYSWVVVDSAKMQTEIREYVLKADGTGEYRTAVAGDKAETLAKGFSLTWSRGEYVENNAWIELHIVYAEASGMKPQTIKWGSASLSVDGQTYSRAKYIDNVDNIYANFANTTWAKADSTFFVEMDTVPFTYLEWTQAKGDDTYLSEEEIAAKREYFAQQWVKDTIAWYNETFSKKVVDSIRVTTKKKGDKFACVYYIGKEKTELVPVETRLGAEKIDCSQFHFDRTNTNENTGDFTYHYFEQDAAYLADPTTGNMCDSTVSFKIDHWCISKPSTTGSFELLGVGTLTESVERIENGTQVKNVHNSRDYVKGFTVVGFYVGEEITIDGKKHEFVK